MTMQTMHGGPLDGCQLDVADHIHRLVQPCITPDGAGRSLAEMEPEIRFDYETGAITAPADLVLGCRPVYYQRTDEGFAVVTQPEET